MSLLGDVWSIIAGNSVEISTAATAIFTGLMAWISWRQNRARLIAEWNFDYPHKNPIFVRITVRNGLPYSVRPSRIWASKRFVRDIQPNGKDKKHSSWAANESPIIGMAPIEPHKFGTFSFTVWLDWHSVQQQQQRWPARLRRWLAKVAWKSASLRVHHGTSVHFQITIDSNLSTSLRRTIKAKTRIPLAAAENNITPTARTENQS